MNLKELKYDDFCAAELYEVLAAMPESEREIALIDVLRQAKALRVTGFRKALKTYLSSQQSTISQSIPDFDNTPREIAKDLVIRLGRWHCDGGIYRFRGDEKIRACWHEIFPAEILTDAETGEMSIKIIYRFGELDKWRELTVGTDVLFDSKKIISLASFGVSVCSGRQAQELVEYIREMVDLNRHDLKQRRAVSRLGWHSGEFILPSAKGDLAFSGNSNFQNCFRAIRKCGDIEAWIAEIQKVRGESLAARLMTSASFASVLVEPLGILPFICHLWSPVSGTGKTVCLMCAASIWGDPRVGCGFVETCRSTPTGYELKADFLNSLPLCLDETQLIRDSKGKLNLDVYALTQGSGKLRGNKSLGVNRTTHWANTISSTGESPLTDANAASGLINRVLEIEVDPQKPCIKDGHKTAEIIGRNFGFAGPVFVAKLRSEGVLEAREMFSSYFKALTGADATGKLASSLAALLTADRMASDLFFDGEKHLTPDDVVRFCKTENEVDIGERAYNFLQSWIAQNQNRFYCYNGEQLSNVPSGEIFGKLYGGYATVIRSAFSKALAEVGLNEKSALSALKAKGLIQTREDGRGFTVTQRPFAGATPCECVLLKLV